MEFRKAVFEDLPEVLLLYQKATQHMIDNGVKQWNEFYPNEEILKSDIENDSLYLSMHDSQIACVFVLDQKCDSEYTKGNWMYPLSSFAVVHRLCVNPAFQRQGLGFQAMLAVESIVKDMKIDSIRLDAYSQNPAALRLYEKLGYSKVGTVTFHLVCHLFEKLL